MAHLEAAMRRSQCTHVTSSLGVWDSSCPKMSTAGFTCELADRELSSALQQAYVA